MNIVWAPFSYEILTHIFILKILSCVLVKYWVFSSLSAELLSPMVPPATESVIHMIICLIPYDQKCGVRWELDWCLSEGPEAEFLTVI